MTKKTYTYHRNSRVAKMNALQKGGKYLGYMDQVELNFYIIKESKKDKKIPVRETGCYVVEYETK
jgi:hypothetical protein